MERITISVPPSIKRRLEEAAHKDRRSVNIMAGLIIEWWFESKGEVGSPKPAPQKEFALPPVKRTLDAPPPMPSVELGMMEIPVPAL